MKFKIFHGLREYKCYRKDNIPLKFFYKWLWEKWKYDLNILILSPFIILIVLSAAVRDISEWVLNIIDDILPDSFRVSDEGMRKVVIEAKEWEKNNK